MIRTASFPMYNFPEIRPVLDEWWVGLSRHLREEGVRDVPEKLAHGDSSKALWEDPGLMMTQCCGYDVVARYRDVLVPIATPHFSVPGCTGPEYTSFLVVSDSNPASDVLQMHGCVAVINGPESHSGMSALRHLVASCSSEGKFFSRIEVSGAHVESLDFVKSGKADVTPIDCVTYAFLERYRPESIWGLRILGRTFSAPAPPYVTLKSAGNRLIERIWIALQAAFDDAALRGVRQQLFLRDIERSEIQDYEKIRQFEEYAVRLGYPVLT